jgi:hypothetical protein
MFILAGAALGALLAGAIARDGHDRPPTNYDEEIVGAYTLPDPLLFNDGTPVRTAADWTERRRVEVQELFVAAVHGRTPHPPHETRFEVFDHDVRAIGGKAVRKQIAMRFIPDAGGPVANLLLYLPVGAGPAPVFLLLNFPGNQTLVSDPAVLPATFHDRAMGARHRAPEESRGSDAGFDLEKLLDRGYGFATVCYQEIEPDFDTGYAHGLRSCFFAPEQTEPAPDDWGAIGAWAFGLSRALDYLETVPAVDARRVAAVGHSRLGKTVLWAGAQDPRFAMVIANCSGAGGAALARRNYGETIRNLVDVFPHWFCGNLRTYADNVANLPVDMHELIGLNAPRPVYVTAAEEDRWADPKGQFLACVAAGPVYRLLGARDLGTDHLPPLDEPVHGTIGFHLRRGGHAVTAFDWDQFLAFADMHLRGIGSG